MLQAAAVLNRIDLEIVENGSLSARALRHAITLDHAAYDCFYLTLAERESIPMVTADASFQRKVGASALPIRVLLLHEAFAQL